MRAASQNPQGYVRLRSKYRDRRSKYRDIRSRYRDIKAVLHTYNLTAPGTVGRSPVGRSTGRRDLDRVWVGFDLRPKGIQKKEGGKIKIVSIHTPSVFSTYKGVCEEHRQTGTAPIPSVHFNYSLT